MEKYLPHMQQALALAAAAAAMGEVPVGAVVVDDATGAIIAAAHNQNIALNDPTAHAEVLAMRAACQARGSRYLDGCTLVVTLEPCVMCAGAASWARLDRIVYGAADPKTGGLNQGPAVFTHATTHHKPQVMGGLLAPACAQILKDFFQAKRV